MATSKERFTSYGGSEAPAHEKVEFVKDPARTYGDQPKALQVTRYDFHRNFPNPQVAQANAIGSSFQAYIDTQPVVTNWFRSFLLQIDAQTNVIWLPADVHPIFSGIRLIGKTTGSVYGDVKINHAPIYQKIMCKRDTEITDYLNMLPKQGLFKSKQPPATNYLGFSRQINDTTLSQELTGSPDSKFEPQYYKCGAASGVAYPNTSAFERQEMQLGVFSAHGVFALNKNIDLGEVCSLEVYYDTTALGHQGTSTTNPMVSPSALSTATNVQIKNIIFNQCIETDPGAIAEAQAERMAEKVVPIPWAKIDISQTTSVSAITPTMYFSNSDGTFLRDVTYTAMPTSRKTSAALNQLFQHANYNDPSIYDGTLGGMFRQFFTDLDGKQLQKYPVDCMAQNPNGANQVIFVEEDYNQQRKMLAHSIIQDYEMFRKNWAWTDSFTGQSNPLNENRQDVLGGATIAGSVNNRKWTFNCSTVQQQSGGGTASLLHVIIARLTWYLKLGPNGGAVYPFLQTQPQPAVKIAQAAIPSAE